MSRKGNCWDNAVVARIARQVLSYEQEESFFSTMKLELGLNKVIGSREVTKAVVSEREQPVRCCLVSKKWIEVFYNWKRLHSTIGYKLSAEFEDSWTQAQVPTFKSTTS